MEKRNTRKIAGYERKIEETLDYIEHDTLNEPVLQELYEEIQSNYNLVKKWRKDEETDWVVIDDFLESTANQAETLTNAYDKE